jgi:hypothetical protein
MHLDVTRPESYARLKRAEQELTKFQGIRAGEIRIVMAMVRDKIAALIQAHDKACEHAAAQISGVSPERGSEARTEANRFYNSLDPWLSSGIPDPHGMRAKVSEALKHIEEAAAEDKKPQAAADAQGAAGQGHAGPQLAPQAAPQTKKSFWQRFGDTFKSKDTLAKEEQTQKAIQLGAPDGDVAQHILSKQLGGIKAISKGQVVIVDTDAELATYWDKHYPPQQSWAVMQQTTFSGKALRGFNVDGYSYICIENCAKTGGGGLKTTIHEMLHGNSDPGICGVLGEGGLTEGLTEWITQTVCAKAGVVGPPSYIKHTELVHAIIAAGFAASDLQKMYLNGGWKKLVDWVNKLTKGRWLQFRGAFIDGRFDEAIAMLAGGGP